MRLTYRTADGATVVCENCPKQGNCHIPSTCLNVMCERLCAYEDTGFEPEEIEDRQDVCLWIPEDRFAEIINAEADGRLVVFPCKVGDTLYAPTRNFVSEFRVSQFDFGGYAEPYLWVNWYLTKGITGNFRIDGIRASEIGKTVFLTREEAEAALREVDT